MLIYSSLPSQLENELKGGQLLKILFPNLEYYQVGKKSS